MPKPKTADRPSQRLPRRLAVPRETLVERLPRALCPTGWRENWNPPKVRGTYIALAYVPWMAELLTVTAVPRVTDDEWRMAIERLTFEAEEGCGVSLEALRLIRPEIAERFTTGKSEPSAALVQETVAKNQRMSAGKPR